jgi:parvulin-like peptidyl-prolyl isomerase
LNYVAHGDSAVLFEVRHADLDLLALSFVVGSFAVLGSIRSRPRRAGSAEAAAEDTPIVAKVGSRDVRAGELERLLQQEMERDRQFMPAGPSLAEMPARRLRVLDRFKQEEALAAAAKKEGITASDADIERARDEAFAQIRSNYARALGLKENASDAEINSALVKAGQNLTINDLKASLPTDALRNQVLYEKLRDKLKPAATAEPAPSVERVRNNYADIKVRHILIRTGPGGLPDEQARAKAQKLLDAIKKDPASFARLANENTQDPGNSPPGKPKQGGLYDWAPASGYVAPFTNAALSVKPGEVYPEP